MSKQLIEAIYLSGNTDLLNLKRFEFKVQLEYNKLDLSSFNDDEKIL